MEEHDLLSNYTLHLLFTDDPHDPHMQTISLGQYIEYHNLSDFSRLCGHSFIIFTDKELCRTVLQHFGGAE